MASARETATGMRTINPIAREGVDVGWTGRPVSGPYRVCAVYPRSGTDGLAGVRPL